MCWGSGTRIILIWTITLSVYSNSMFVLGKNCDCETESLSYPDCGIIPTSSTIINGSKSSYPWMVFLYSITDAGESFCGGSLISNLQVATAAHCVIGKTTDELAVVLGNENANEELKRSNYRFLFKIEIFPLYEILDKTMDKTFKYSSDVAVLTLDKPLVLSPQINPICLPSVAEAGETYEGKEAIVSGWGVTETGETSVEQQMEVKIPIISNSQCRAFYDWIGRFYF